MTAWESLLRVALRAVGRLIVAGVLTREAGAVFIRWAFNGYQTDVAGRQSEKAAAMDHNPNASPSGTFTADLWCHKCQTHRVAAALDLCPVCADERRHA